MMIVPLGPQMVMLHALCYSVDADIKVKVKNIVEQLIIKLLELTFKSKVY